jgi:outer membrane protein, heavy metal efflux system
MLASALLGAATALAGCVSRDAGYDTTRRIVRERTGYEFEPSAETGAAGRAVSALIARPLTADSAARIALLNSPRLRADLEAIGMARAELVSALRIPNPVADVALRYHVNHEGPVEADIGVTESLSELILIPWRNGAASSALDAASYDAAGAALDIALEARRAFYAFQAATQLVELRRSVLEAAAASHEAAKRIHEAGNITDLDLANERALYEEARLDAADAEVSLFGSRERMNTVLGLWGRDSTWTVSGRMPSPPEREIELEQIERVALDKSLDLTAARLRFTAAARRANVASAEGLLPDLRAGVGAEREEDGWDVGPLVELEVPLFYQGQGEVALAEAQMRRERALYTDSAIRIRAQSRTAANRVLVARERVLFYRDVVLPLRQRIVENAQLQYNAMQIGVFQLLQAKREQIDAGRRYVETLRDYWIARCDLEHLRAGRMLPDGAVTGVETDSRTPRAGASRDRTH